MASRRSRIREFIQYFWIAEALDFALKTERNPKFKDQLSLMKGIYSKTIEQRNNNTITQDEADRRQAETARNLLEFIDRNDRRRFLNITLVSQAIGFLISGWVIGFMMGNFYPGIKNLTLSNKKAEVELSSMQPLQLSTHKILTSEECSLTSLADLATESKNKVYTIPQSVVIENKNDCEKDYFYTAKEISRKEIEKITDISPLNFQKDSEQYFNLDSAKHVLNQIMSKLKAADDTILVIGFSDFGTSVDSNSRLELSKMRGVKVREDLKSFIAPYDDECQILSRIKVQYLGDKKPIKEEKSKEGNIINRRVEFFIIKKRISEN